MSRKPERPEIKRLFKFTGMNFNEKYRDYLDEGHYGLDINDPEINKILDKMFEEVFTKIPGFKYQQIKLKFGRCCFYTNLGFGHHTFMVESYINKYLENKQNENK